MSKIEDWLKTALPITAKMTYGFETDISSRKKLYEQLDQLKDENKQLKQKIEQLKYSNETLNKALDDKNFNKKCYLKFNNGVVEDLFCKHAVKELMYEIEEQSKKLHELLDKNRHYDYLICSYHICFEGALGAIQALLNNNCDDPKYWANGAKTYLSFRYEEQQEAKKIYDKHFAQLRQENKKLKEMNHGLSEKFANVCGGCFEQELREKYEQCLDRIEEIAKDKVNAGCSMRNKDCDSSCNKCLLNSLNEILQKIKEVKGNE